MLYYLTVNLNCYALLSSLQPAGTDSSCTSQHLQELWGGPEYESKEGIPLIVLHVYFF